MPFDEAQPPTYGTKIAYDPAVLHLTTRKSPKGRLMVVFVFGGVLAAKMGFKDGEPKPQLQIAWGTEKDLGKVRLVLAQNAPGFPCRYAKGTKTWLVFCSVLPKTFAEVSYTGLKLQGEILPVDGRAFYMAHLPKGFYAGETPALVHSAASAIAQVARAKGVR